MGYEIINSTKFLEGYIAPRARVSDINSIKKRK